MKKFNLGLVSCHRTELMGLATIMIIICHAPVYGVQLTTIMTKVLGIGNLGVEIFFFLSGIGLTFSIRQKKAMSLWYRKRLLRVLVPYLAIAIPWYGIHSVLYNDSLIDFLCNVSTMNYWLYHKGAWFVAILLPLYLIMPILYKILVVGRFRILFLVVFVAISSSSSLVEISNDNEIIANIIWAVHRLPCFFIGIYITPYIIQKREVSLINILILACALMICLRCIDISIGYLWPAIFIIITVFCMIIERSSKFNYLFGILGVISLESYIMNICLGDLFPQFQSWNYNGYTRYALIAIIGIAIAYSINKFISKPLVNLFSK